MRESEQNSNLDKIARLRSEAYSDQVEYKNLIKLIFDVSAPPSEERKQQANRFNELSLITIEKTIEIALLTHEIGADNQVECESIVQFVNSHSIIGNTPKHYQNVFFKIFSKYSREQLHDLFAALNKHAVLIPFLYQGKLEQRTSDPDSIEFVPLLPGYELFYDRVNPVKLDLKNIKIPSKYKNKFMPKKVWDAFEEVKDFYFYGTNDDGKSPADADNEKICDVERLRRQLEQISEDHSRLVDKSDAAIISRSVAGLPTLLTDVRLNATEIYRNTESIYAQIVKIILQGWEDGNDSVRIECESLASDISSKAAGLGHESYKRILKKVFEKFTARQINDLISALSHHGVIDRFALEGNKILPQSVRLAYRRLTKAQAEAQPSFSDRTRAIVASMSEVEKMRARFDELHNDAEDEFHNPSTILAKAVEMGQTAVMKKLEREGLELSLLPLHIIIKSFRATDAGLEKDAQRVMEQLTAAVPNDFQKGVKKTWQKKAFESLFKKDLITLLTALDATGRLRDLLVYAGSDDNTLPGFFVREMVKFIEASGPMPSELEIFHALFAELNQINDTAMGAGASPDMVKRLEELQSNKLLLRVVDLSMKAMNRAGFSDGQAGMKFDKEKNYFAIEIPDREDVYVDVIEKNGLIIDVSISKPSVHNGNWNKATLDELSNWIARKYGLNPGDLETKADKGETLNCKSAEHGEMNIQGVSEEGSDKWIDIIVPELELKLKGRDIHSEEGQNSLLKEAVMRKIDKLHDEFTASAQESWGTLSHTTPSEKATSILSKKFLNLIDILLLSEEANITLRREELLDVKKTFSVLKDEKNIGLIKKAFLKAFGPRSNKEIERMFKVLNKHDLLLDILYPGRFLIHNGGLLTFEPLIFSGGEGKDIYDQAQKIRFQDKRYDHLARLLRKHTNPALPKKIWNVWGEWRKHNGPGLDTRPLTSPERLTPIQQDFKAGVQALARSEVSTYMLPGGMALITNNEKMAENPAIVFLTLLDGKYNKAQIEYLSQWIDETFQSLNEDQKDLFFSTLHLSKKVGELSRGGYLSDNLLTSLNEWKKRLDPAIDDNKGIDEKTPAIIPIASPQDAAETYGLLIGMELLRKGYRADDYKVTEEDGTWRCADRYGNPVETRFISEAELAGIELPDAAEVQIRTLLSPASEFYAGNITPEFLRQSNTIAEKSFDFNGVFHAPVFANSQIDPLEQEPENLLQSIDIIPVENLLPEGLSTSNGIKSKLAREYSEEEGAPQPRLRWILEALSEDGFTHRDINLYHNKWLGFGMKDHTYVVIQAMNDDHCFQIAVCLRLTENFNDSLENRRWDDLESDVGHATYILRESIDWETQKLEIADLKHRDDVWTAACYTDRQYLSRLRKCCYTPLGDLDPQLKTTMGWGGPEIATQVLQSVKAFHEETGQMYRTIDNTPIEHGPLAGKTTPARLFSSLYTGAIEGLEQIKTQKGLLEEALTRPGLPEWQDTIQTNAPVIEQLPIKTIDLREAFEDAVLYMLVRHKLPENPDLTEALEKNTVIGREELGISIEIKLDRDFYAAMGLANDNYEPVSPSVIRQFARLLDRSRIPA